MGHAKILLSYGGDRRPPSPKTELVIRKQIKNCFSFSFLLASFEVEHDDGICKVVQFVKLRIFLDFWPEDRFRFQKYQMSSKNADLTTITGKDSRQIVFLHNIFFRDIVSV